MDRARLLETLRARGLYLSEHDPVLEVATICEVALADAVASLKESTREQADRITAAAVQATEAARGAASSVVTRAGDWSADRLKTAADEAARTVLQRITDEADRAERACRAARRASTIAILGCLGVLAAAAGWYGAVIF